MNHAPFQSPANVCASLLPCCASSLGGQHRFEHRQRDRDAHSFNIGSSVKDAFSIKTLLLLLLIAGLVGAALVVSRGSAFFIWKGVLLTIPMTKDENLLSVRAAS